MKYYEKYKHEDEKMAELFTLFHEFVHVELKEHDIDLYKDFIDELEDYVESVDEEEILEALSHLKKKDGTPGAKWTMDEVASVVTQFNIKERLGDLYCPKLFCFAMNYAYAVHCGTNKTLSSYVETAIEEFLDHNIPIKVKIKLINERA
jgi:DNA-directed RNA polymerase specialized sigma54-like protein